MPFPGENTDADLAGLQGMVEHVGVRNALLQQHTGEAPMPGAPTLQDAGLANGGSFNPAFPPGLAPQVPGVDMSAGLPSHLGGDGTHAGRAYGEYAVYDDAPPPAAQTPPPASDGQMHLSLNVHPDMSEQDISDAVSRALNAARSDMRGVAPDQLNLSAVVEAEHQTPDELLLADHTKLKCPKCGTVQSAKNKTCTNCGHDLSDARKAKFANLSAAQVGDCVDLTDADDQALLLALPEFLQKKKDEASNAAGDDKAAQGKKKICPECKTENKADALKCTKCKHSLVGIKARVLNAAVAPIDRQQYGPPADLVGVTADGTLGDIEVTEGAPDAEAGEGAPPNLRIATAADDPDGDGDTNDSCGTCAHFSDDGRCLLYDYPVTEDQVCDDFEDEDTPDDTLVASQQPSDGHLAKIYQLSLAQEANKPGVETDDGLVWKIACKSGTLALSPGPGQIDLDKPLNLTGDLFRGMVASLEEKAFPYCTVPETHANGSLENTGYVRKGVVLDQQQALADNRIGQAAKNLIKLDPPDTEYLLAGIEFTEPEVKQKALNGSIPDTSIGVKFQYRNKRTGKLFREAWEHLALTPVPWVDGLPAFGLSAGSEPRIVDADDALARYDGVYVDYASREALAEDLATNLYMAMPQEARDKKKHKLPDGSFPIDNEEDLKNAISAFGRAKNKGQAKRWIKSRAKALGKTDLLPDGWNMSQQRPPDEDLDLAMQVSMKGDPYDPFKAQAAVASLQPGDSWTWNYGVSVTAIAAGDDVDNDADTEGAGDTDADETYYLLDAGYNPDEDWQRGPTLFRTLDALMRAVSDAVAQQQARREAQKLLRDREVPVGLSVGQLPGEDLQLAGRAARRRHRRDTPLPEADRTGSLPGELHASATETSNDMSDISTGITVEQLLAEQQAKLEALEAENVELRTAAQSASVQLSAQQIEAHEGRVERYLTRKQSQGVPPGLLLAAKTILQADTPNREVGGDDGLNLSVTVPQPKADGEGTEQVEKTFRTATEIVDFLLSAVPSLSAQEASRIAALGGEVAEFHLGQHRATQKDKGEADLSALDEYERAEHPERFDADGNRKTTSAAA